MKKFLVCTKFEVFGCFDIEAEDFEAAERIVTAMSVHDLREKVNADVPYDALVMDVTVEEKE